MSQQLITPVAPTSLPPPAETSVLTATQFRQLIEVPPDRAILFILLYHGVRREELTKLKVKDYNQTWRGIPHLREGQGGKTRFVPTRPGTLTP